MTPQDFFGSAAPLTQADIKRAAGLIGTTPPVIAAVAQVEASGAGFLTDGRPKILFEAHIFGKMTAYKYANVTDSRGNAISSRTWNKALYGSAGTWQYERLALAMQYDESSALRACSWGAFQVMGLNHSVCGFSTPQEFAKAHVRSSGEQLEAFCRFVIGNKLDDELRDQRWADFARGYNGPEYAKNKYDTKMRDAHAQLVGNWTKKYVDAQTVILQIHDMALDTSAPTFTRGEIAKVQAALNINCVVIPLLVADGWMGAKTEAALRKYQTIVGLPVTGVIDRDTYSRLLG